MVEKRTPLEQIRIDVVWAPIILSKKFPTLSKLLKATLSMFHGNASVEGSVNNTRNTLGDRSHSLTDETLESRNIIKSAIKSSSSKCCFDFNISEEHIRTYKESWKSMCPNANEEDEKDENVEDTEHSSSAGSLGKKRRHSDSEDGSSNEELPDPEPPKGPENSEGWKEYKIPKIQGGVPTSQKEVLTSQKQVPTSQKGAPTRKNGAPKQKGISHFFVKKN